MKNNKQITGKSVLPDEVIINKIYLIREQKVMLDRDLSILYKVTTGNLNKAVRRNLKRFPADFMFKLKTTEFKNLIFQNGISSWGGSRRLPYAFTEQGVAMLSGILNSERAILTNIRIIRIFTRLRQVMLTHQDILLKLEIMEKEAGKQKKDIQIIFSALKQLLHQPVEPRKRIGYKRGNEGQ